MERTPEVTRVLRELVYQRERGCNTFNAALAVFTVSKFAGEGLSVLDPSIGWTSRMIASCVCKCANYVGYDTNTNLFPLYDKAISKLKEVGSQTNIVLHNKPFESDTYKFEKGDEYHGKFNLVYTSPPFYDKELYRGEETSTTIYNTVDLWMKDFYHPLVRNSYNALTLGGTLVMYLPTPLASLKRLKIDSTSTFVPDLMLLEAMKVISEMGGNPTPQVLGYARSLDNGRDNIAGSYVWKKNKL